MGGGGGGAPRPPGGGGGGGGGGGIVVDSDFVYAPDGYGGGAVFGDDAPQLGLEER